MGQLKPGGRLIAPAGECSQHLVLLEKNSKNQFRKEQLIPLEFVPMTERDQSS
ncbi:MAG: hypothetical protein WD431_25950 [Cyclobacteriaceae bacterium]